MRKIFAVVSALALAAALFAQAPAVPKEATRPAGEFVIHMVDGTQKLLSSYRGKFIVMAFMYTTCPHCQAMAGTLAKIQTEYADKGLQVLGVTFDAGAANNVTGFIKMTGANFPCGYSTPDQVVKFMHAQDDYYVPMLAFIDRTGAVRSQYISYGDPNGIADKFLADRDANIHKEIDKYLKTPVPTSTAKQAPKS